MESTSGIYRFRYPAPTKGKAEVQILRSVIQRSSSWDTFIYEAQKYSFHSYVSKESKITLLVTLPENSLKRVFPNP